MHPLLAFFGIASAAIVFGGFSPSAVAQESKSVWTCQSIGSGGMEPVGDREGHSILVSQGSCRIDGGPLSGGVSTDMAVWEWDGAKAVRLSVTGVIRKPGATVVYGGASANLTLAITDGKVSGWTASGQDNYLLATGSASPLTGRSFTWTAKPTGAGQFAVEVKDE